MSKDPLSPFADSSREPPASAASRSSVVPGGRFRTVQIAGSWVLLLGLVAAIVIALWLGDMHPRTLIPPTAALLIVLSLLLVHWTRKKERTAASRWSFMRVAWTVVFWAGFTGVTLLVVMGGVSFAPSHTEVSVDYEARVVPLEPGTYEVLLPTMNPPLEVKIAEGTARVEREDTEHGEALRIIGDGNVTVRARHEERVASDRFNDYHPTLTTSTQVNPATDSDKQYHVYSDRPLSIDLRMDVGYPCGIYENRLRAETTPGWGTYDGTLNHPHGDVCGTDLLLLPLAFVMPLSMLLLPLFIVGTVALTGLEGWTRWRRRPGPKRRPKENVGARPNNARSHK